jgi:hypothetical protein
VRGRRNLLHVDLASMKSVIITTFTDGDVVSPRWISPDRMVFGVRDLKQGEGGQVGQGLFAIDKDGSEFESMVERGLLSEGGKRQMPAGTFFHSKGVGTAPDEIWVQQWSSAGTRTQGHVTIHRLHTRTLRSTLLTSGAPGRAIRWLFDAKGDPRGVVTRAENRFTFHLRDTLDAPLAGRGAVGLDEPGKHAAGLRCRWPGLCAGLSGRQRLRRRVRHGPAQRRHRRRTGGRPQGLRPRGGVQPRCARCAGCAPGLR